MPSFIARVLVVILIWTGGVAFQAERAKCPRCVLKCRMSDQDRASGALKPGQCDACWGKGSTWSSYYSYSGAVSYYPVKCAECQATGKCPICGGTGRTEPPGHLGLGLFGFLLVLSSALLRWRRAWPQSKALDVALPILAVGGFILLAFGSTQQANSEWNP